MNRPSAPVVHLSADSAPKCTTGARGAPGAAPYPRIEFSVSLGRIAAAELQCERVLGGVEVEVACAIAVQQRARAHHLGVQARAAREQAVEPAAVAVGPLQHRRNA